MALSKRLAAACGLILLAGWPLSAQAQWGSTTHSNSTTNSTTTGSSQSTTTTQTRQGSWGNNTMTETTSQTNGTSSSRTNSTTRGTSVTTPSWNSSPSWNHAGAPPRNNNDSTAAAVGALIGVIGAIAEDREARTAPRIQPEQAHGQWVALSNSWSGSRSCDVELSGDKAFLNQGFKLKSQKCWNSPYAQLFAWRPYDGGVALVKHDGGTLAVMRGDGNRLSGRTPDGIELVLHRPGY